MHRAVENGEGRYPDRLQFRAPRGLRKAIQSVADKRLTSPAEWTRQALLRCLEAEGVHLLAGEVLHRAQAPDGRLA